MSKPILHYFNGRGRAEIVRLTMAVAGVQWAEKHIVCAEDMDALRASGKLLFNQVPLLEIDGLQIVQSDAIVRYLGTKYNLMSGVCPANDAHKSNLSVKMNMLYCGARDFLTSSFLGYGFQPFDEVVATARKTIIPKYMPVFEKVLSDQTNGFLVTDSITIADIAVFEVLLWINELCADVFETYPATHQFFLKMVSHKNIANYLNGPMRPRINDDRYIREVKNSLRWN